MEQGVTRSASFADTDRTRVRTRLVGAAMVVLLHLALILLVTRPIVPHHALLDEGRGVVPMTIYSLNRAAFAPQRLIQEIALPPERSPQPADPESRLPKPNSSEPEPAPDLPGPRLDANPEPVNDAAPSPANMPVSNQSPVGGETCDMASVVKAALEADTNVAMGLQLIPARSRSVANAVMLWDGNWIDASRLGGDEAVQPIRAALIDTVRAASPECQLSLVRGPVLIPISDVSGTIAVVIGSGTWHWKDLLSGSVPIPQ